MAMNQSEEQVMIPKYDRSVGSELTGGLRVVKESKCMEAFGLAALKRSAKL